MHLTSSRQHAEPSGRRTHRRTLRRLGVGATLACAVALAIPPVASASTASSIEHFRIVTESTDQPGSILAHGVFTAGGTDYSGKNKDLAVFPDGSFTISHPGGTFTFTLNPNTCVARVTGNGDYTLGHGYGAYRGITGSGSYVLHGLDILARKPNGACDLHAKPVSEQDIIKASGPVSL